MMTFEQFQATRTWSDDLAAVIEDECFVDPAHPERKEQGNVYLGALYIDRVQSWWLPEAKAQGGWHLIIDRSEWITNDLETLERKLYEFAAVEGYCDGEGVTTQC